jgi:hypothetical protein
VIEGLEHDPAADIGVAAMLAPDRVPGQAVISSRSSVCHQRRAVPSTTRFIRRSVCYNPRDGRTYSASMELGGDNTLELRGYLVLPVFGQSEVWMVNGDRGGC